ncbi:MAG: hypothetical protein ACM3MF_09470, partial [Anaerolineae bacterium]
SRKWGIAALSFFSVLMIMACSLSVNAPTAAPAFDPTKASLELQATQMSIELTQAAMSSKAQPVVEQPTAVPPTAAPAPTDLPAPTEDVQASLEAKIKAAKVLLYEDTDELGIGQWIEEAVQGMGLDYTQTGSYSGHFMEYLNSGKKYDLIIVGAEDRSKITGEFWDVISTRLTRDKAALIAEVWYLHRESNGPIAKILGPCGVQNRRRYDAADSVYWWDPTHEVFNTPNQVLPLLHYTSYWWTEAGDKLQLGAGDAKMLAGLSASPSSGEGVLATCLGGRVIIQTFCNHDYHEADIIPLWQNYIHYTLKNHFLATP